jgi:hypothetical protein
MESKCIERYNKKLRFTNHCQRIVGELRDETIALKTKIFSIARDLTFWAISLQNWLHSST